MGQGKDQNCPLQGQEITPLPRSPNPPQEITGQGDSQQPQGIRPNFLAVAHVKGGIGQQRYEQQPR